MLIGNAMYIAGRALQLRWSLARTEPPPRHAKAVPPPTAAIFRHL
jgi:hypothetical protein